MQATIGPKARWGHVEHLLADLIDAVRWLTWLYARVHSKTAPPRPQPVNRPGVERQGRFGTARLPLPQLKAYLARFRPKGGD